MFSISPLPGSSRGGKCYFSAAQKLTFTLHVKVLGLLVPEQMP